MNIREDDIVSAVAIGTDTGEDDDTPAAEVVGLGSAPIMDVTDVADLIADEDEDPSADVGTALPDDGE